MSVPREPSSTTRGGVEDGRLLRSRPPTGSWPARAASLVAAAILLALPLGAGGQEEAGAQGDPPRLTLERLYSLPRLIGTAPKGFAWSPDGNRLAFLWNDEGRNFHDVWIVDADDPEARPRRVTSLPRPEPEPEDPTDPASLAAAEERVERDPGATAVTWHPDGGRLLVTFRGDLWLVGSGHEPVRITEGEAPVRSAAYAPGGRALAFLRGGELWTVPVGNEAAREGEAAEEAAGGTAGVAGHGRPLRRTRLARGGPPLEAEVTGFRWSPTGDRIALLESDRSEVEVRGIPRYLGEETELTSIHRAFPGEPAGRWRIGVIPAERGDGGDTIRWIELERTPGDVFPELLLDFRWSPRGGWIAIDASDYLAEDRRIFLARIEGGDAPRARIRVREEDPGNTNFSYWRIAWARDGARLYFLSDRSEDYHVYAADADDPGSEPRRLTRGAWAVAELFPVEGGLVVVGNRGRGEERHLFRVDENGGPPERLSVRPGTHTPTLSPDGRRAAVAFSSDEVPPDLFLTELDASLPEDRRERRITESPLPEFSEYRWTAPEYVTFESHVDGVPLHGRLTLPPDFHPERTYPAILGSVYTNTVRNQWGGRTAHPTWGLDQYLAQEGFVLLNVDVRGSWGRGRAFRRGIRLSYGGPDTEDLASGVRFLESLGYVDTDRVGIWGSSYGGLMTLMSLFRRPHLYAAGVAGAPATSVWHALPGQMAVMQRPEDRPAEYAESSAFLHAHGLEDPLLIIHGTRDRIVLFKDTMILMRRLILLGKDADLLALPGSGHGWDLEGLAQTRFTFGKLVEHFERHLKGEGDR